MILRVGRKESWKFSKTRIAIFISGRISANINRKYSRRNFRSWEAVQNICRQKRQVLSSMLIRFFFFCNFHISVDGNLNNFFLSKSKDNKHSRAATNKYLNAFVYCIKTEYRFIIIFCSGRNRNPSDRTDSVFYYLAENIELPSMHFSYISRKLNSL